MLAGCKSNGGNSTTATESAYPFSGPTLTIEQAEQIAETFLSAWRITDYAAMYSLITPNSRDAYTPDEFVAEYNDVAELVGLNTLDMHVTNSLREGSTASVLYDVTFHTQVFGDITDSERTMQLIETPEGWRVAWSRADIFSGLENGATLQIQSSMPNRGNIYDRNGNVLADQNGQAITLFITERDITDEKACVDELVQILELEPDVIQATFDRFAPDIRFRIGEVNPDIYRAEEQNLLTRCDIGDDPTDTQTRSARRYLSTLAPHIVGYVGKIQPEQEEVYRRKGYPPDAIVGQSGIEQSYESYLAGTIGRTLMVVAPSGEILRTLAEIPPTPGQSVYLTIDRDLQQKLQDTMEDAYASAPAWTGTSRGAAVVVMDVHSGEVLGAVSYPWFDPSIFNPDAPIANRDEQIQAINQDPRTPLLNRVTSGLYPPGSVFKIVSMAAGLDSGVYTTDTWYTCTTTWSNPEDALPMRKDWTYGSGYSHGTINLPHALTYSCDPYFYQLGATLNGVDNQILTRHARQMGLGVPTGQTDLQEETGQIPDSNSIFAFNGRSWAMANSVNLVIGQGPIQVTPLQITRMVAAVANGGTLYKPQFVRKVQLISDDPVYVAVPTPTEVLDYDPSIWESIREAMCQVTLDPNGTARYMFEPWYKFQKTDIVVCGKTGTAQTGGAGVNPQAWFASFVPQNNPEVAIVAIVENSCEGSEVAAPLVRRVVEDYYDMPHSPWPDLWTGGCFTLGE